MEIFLNGQPQQVHPNLSIAELMASLAIEGRRLAVEVNLEIIPRSTYSSYRLSPGDRVEIVHAIGGG